MPNFADLPPANRVTGRRQVSELARAAVSVAQNPAYSWDAVARQFDELFVGLADGTESTNARGS
jgi:hypothetical protein